MNNQFPHKFYYNLSVNTQVVVYIIFFIIITLYFSLIILAAVPPVSKDALTHHLAIPKLYLKTGAIYEIPDLIFSYYPMNIDLLYIIPLALGNDILAKYMHMAFGIMTGITIYKFLKQYLDTNYALLGFLIFVSTPVIIKLSITAYVDLGLIFFSTASAFLLLQWAKKNFRLRYLILAGVMCGLAAGTKYVGLITLFLLGCFTPLLYLSTARSSSNKYAIFFGITFVSISIIILSPWLIRNFLWTSNPIYPLFNSIINPSDAINHFSVPPLLSRKILYGESWFEIASTPLRVFFQGQDESHQYFDGKLNPFFLLLSLASFIPHKNQTSLGRVKIFFLLFIVLFILFAFFFTEMRIRYISPIIPFLTILSIFGIKNITELAKSYSSKSIIIPILIVIATISYNFSYLFHQFSIVKPLPYIIGSISRDTYISQFRSEYPIIKYANLKLSPNHKILAVFLGNRGYYFDVSVGFDLSSGKSMIQSTILNSKSADNISNELTNAGYTHLIINYDLFNKFIWQKLPLKDQHKFNSFISLHTMLLYENNGHGLFEISNN